MNQIVEYKPPQLGAGAAVRAIVPTTMEDAYRLAKAVCAAGMAPRGMDTPEKAMIAIMRGLEVGLTPFQALDKIAIVNGRPVIWGDGALALVRASGLCEYVDESIMGKGEERLALCQSKRRGEAKQIERTFSVADAKKAGLWGKQGPWTQFPDRMLQMRARAFCLRDGFADVLGGLYLKEEFDGIEGRAERQAAPIPPEPPPDPEESRSVRSDSPPSTFDFAEYRKLLSASTSLDHINETYETTMRAYTLTAEQQEEADAILREVAKPLWEAQQGK